MKTIQLTILSALLTLNIFAQQPNQVQEFPKTIEGQFQKLYKQSNNYQVYKVMRKDNFLKLQKNVLDSISAIEKEASNKQQTINSQQKTIATLESTISKTNKELTTSLSKEDNISLFGLQLSKITYNTILWGIIAGLLAGLLFFIFRYNNSNSLTNEARKSLSDVEEELEKYRKKSIEKEQKLRRQLQDEINKQRGV
ncbi:MULTISPECIES: hypothetical protein [Tenacibaculum]|uniref:hypothetical protein n=1 Tax=Tenacibaculum TaxID=104267 RepID=UPI001F0AB75D|nr:MULTISPECIES: hypothetical protein [Tenacibaculum]MCH3882788.1 hypothetical protein [Tenacibaculum aquimarinum]MCH3884594.1 hypothetical protein [Tenacibaculum aquimarinum]MDO6600501.1 hypothetical protein [Tenacibaculum sp. 1_MG-2023]